MAGFVPDSSAPRGGLDRLAAEIVACERCPRLVAHCREVARLRVRRFRDQEYWGRPVPGFGDPEARLLIVGLAPAAHGANRTGRMFTGDDSGDWLYNALHRAGIANQPHSIDRRDGLVVSGAYITAALRCAPPGNRPARAEIEACRRHLLTELSLLSRVQVVLVLGRVAFDAYIAARRELGLAIPSPRPRFQHGAEVPLAEGTWLLASYHPSRQNTHTGVLTRKMLDKVIRRARRISERDGRWQSGR